jgi:hypothetical protein
VLSAPGAHCKNWASHASDDNDDDDDEDDEDDEDEDEDGFLAPSVLPPTTLARKFAFSHADETSCLLTKQRTSDAHT